MNAHYHGLPSTNGSGPACRGVCLGRRVPLFQPIDALARRMLWVKYFKPGIVRSIALVEVVCGIGLLLPLIFTDFSTSLLLYSGGLLIVTMIGAVVTHAIIGL